MEDLVLMEETATSLLLCLFSFVSVFLLPLSKGWQFLHSVNIAQALPGKAEEASFHS